MNMKDYLNKLIKKNNFGEENKLQNYYNFYYVSDMIKIMQYLSNKI